MGYENFLRPKTELALIRYLPKAAKSLSSVLWAFSREILARIQDVADVNRTMGSRPCLSAKHKKATQRVVYLYLIRGVGEDALPRKRLFVSLCDDVQY